MISLKPRAAPSATTRAQQVDGHQPPGPSLPAAGDLQRAVGRVLLAHDAAHVAGVRVRVEGDAPRPRIGPHEGAVAAPEHERVERFDLPDVIVDRRHVPALAVEIAALSEPPRECRIDGEALHLLGQRVPRAVPERQAVGPVPDVLGHAARICCDHRYPRLLGLVDDERRVLDPHRGHDDGVHPVEHLAHDVSVAVLVQPLDAIRLPAGKIPSQGLQRVRVLAARAAPDAQERCSGDLSEGPDQIVDPLRRDVRADVAEDEGLAGGSCPAPQAREVEAVVEMDQLAGRDPELVAVPVEEGAGGGVEQVHKLGHFLRVAHAPPDPARPVDDVLLALGRRAPEVAGVAVFGALAVVLAIAGGPQVVRIARMRLHELPAGAHDPEVVQGVDDRDAPRRGLERQRGREVVQVSDMHEVRAEPVEKLGEAPVDAGLPVGVPVARVVDDVQRDPRIIGVGLYAQAEVGGERILLSG